MRKIASIDVCQFIARLHVDCLIPKELCSNLVYEQLKKAAYLVDLLLRHDKQPEEICYL